MSEELNRDAENAAIAPQEPDLPTRRAKDALPVKATWQVIVLGVMYFALGAFLTWLTIYLFFGSEESLSWISWVFAVFIVLGTFSAFYTCWDEVRHIQHALQLDKSGVTARAHILDRWTDNYADGGILTRKTVNHILYTYNDNRNYGKHSINKAVYKAMGDGGWVEIVYLPDAPHVFRLKG
ncbi:MAG: hypothetical protein HPY85_15490 [Anaerolineae bacterium]|nr:hypothetical protein [Anaerolineae bacterium]